MKRYAAKTKLCIEFKVDTSGTFEATIGKNSFTFLLIHHLFDMSYEMFKQISIKGGKFLDLLSNY
jgi:hypothetical protein